MLAHTLKYGALSEAINDKCYTCGRHNIIGVQSICLVIVIFVSLCLAEHCLKDTIVTPASYIFSPLGDPTLIMPITEL
jgi:hypothetical protein